MESFLETIAQFESSTINIMIYDPLTIISIMMFTMLRWLFDLPNELLSMESSDDLPLKKCFSTSLRNEVKKQG